MINETDLAILIFVALLFLYWGFKYWMDRRVDIAHAKERTERLKAGQHQTSSVEDEDTVARPIDSTDDR